MAVLAAFLIIGIFDWIFEGVTFPKDWVGDFWAQFPVSVIFSGALILVVLASFLIKKEEG